MSSGSRFEELAKAKNRKIEMLNAGVEDNIKQKQLEAKLSRIDEETKQRIEEIKNEPVDTELIKQQAVVDLESQKKSNARRRERVIAEGEDELLDIQRRLEEVKRNVAQKKEDAIEEEKVRNLQADQEYQKVMSSADNADQTLKLKISKVEQMANAEKKDIQIELDNITIKNDAQKDSLKEIDSLYDDMKEVAVRVTNSN